MTRMKRANAVRTKIWRDDCLAWCDEQPQPDGRFMNQGYLNRWPERYSAVHPIRHPGVNLAPWNVDAHTLGREIDLQ